MEQAYSYAMHRDIRVPLYGLCNGHRLVVYHVSAAEPVIDIPLNEIEHVWPPLVAALGCKSAWPNGIRPGFRPDMGLALIKAGLVRGEDGEKFFHMFMSLVLTMVARIEDGVYSVNAVCDPVESSLLVTIDFGQEKYEGFLAALPGDLRESVKTALSRQPYQIFFENADAPFMTIAAQIGDTVHTNEDESYCPFEAESFISEYLADDEPPAGDLTSDDE